MIKLEAAATLQPQPFEIDALTSTIEKVVARSAAAPPSPPPL